MSDTFNRLSAMIAWEGGEATPSETLDLFAHLISTGLAWGLQGFYGRTAQRLIDLGYITADGEITDDGREWAD